MAKDPTYWTAAKTKAGYHRWVAIRVLGSPWLYDEEGF
jgi:hypothetical protein